MRRTILGLLFSGLAVSQVKTTPLLSLPGETSHPVLSPDGQTLLFGWCKPDYSCNLSTSAVAGGTITFFAGEDSRDGFPATPVWSPDGARVAFYRMYSRFDVRVFVRDAHGKGERDIGAVCGVDNQASWTPDSRFLMLKVPATESADGPCRLVLVSAETGRHFRVLANRVDYSALSPDGKRIAFADGSQLRLIHLADELRPTGPVITLAREPRTISGVKWTTDSRQVVYQVWGDALYTRRIMIEPGARPERVPSLNGISVSQVLSDGSVLGTQTTQLTAIWQVSLSAPTAPAVVKEPGCSSGAPECSADGRRRVFVSTRTGLAEIRTANANGSQERPLVRSIPGFSDPDDDGAPGPPVWSADGKWIAFTVFARRGNADVRSHLYVVSSAGGPPRRMMPDAYALVSPVWSPDSASIYAIRSWPSEEKSHSFDAPIVRIGLDGAVNTLNVDGMHPQVSRDGKYLFYFTWPRPMLHRIPSSGGAVESLWEKDDLVWQCVAVGARYLYLVRQPLRETKSTLYTLIRLDPETRQSTELASLPFRPQGIHVSLDERFLYMLQDGNPRQRAVRIRSPL